MEKGKLAPSYTKVLVAFDGSEGSWNALQRAALVSKLHGAEVTAISVDEHTPRYARGVGEIREEPELVTEFFNEIHVEAVAAAAKHGIEVKTVGLVGHAAQTIVNYARDNGFDLIVIGHSGHSGVWGTLLGSTAARVVDQASCDVLVAR